MMIFLLNFLMKQKYFILNQNGWTKEKPTHCLFFSANKKMLIRYSFKRFLCVFLSNFLCFVTGLSTKNALLQNRFFLHEKKWLRYSFFFTVLKHWVDSNIWHIFRSPYCHLLTINIDKHSGLNWILSCFYFFLLLQI